MVSLKVKLFHIFAWLESIFALYIYHQYVLTQIKQTYGRQWKFLTYINLHIQLLCFMMCVVKDMLEVCGQWHIASKVGKVKEVFYASIGLPMCVIVCVTFWAIYAVDRELIHPVYLDEILPSWTNHLWHTAILITIVEVACDRHEFPKRSLGLSVTTIFGLAYLSWLFWLSKQSGMWAYPFLAELEGPWLVAFMVVEVLVTWLIYFLGECLNNATGSAKIGKKKKQ